MEPLTNIEELPRPDVPGDSSARQAPHTSTALDRGRVPVRVVVSGAKAGRRAVRSALERSGAIAVVGEAATVAETLVEVIRSRPDVLVLDLDTAADVAVISRMTRVAPETGVLVLSAAEDAGAVTAAMHAGARGYLVKTGEGDQFVRAVHVVAAGEVIVGRQIARRFGDVLRHAARHDPYPFPQLTGRERDVLECVAAGRSNSYIACHLTLAKKTVSNRVSAIFAKLGVADRAEAIVLARDAGLGRGDGKCRSEHP